MPPNSNPQYRENKVSLFDHLKENIAELISSLPIGWGIHQSTDLITISHIKNVIPPQLDKVILVAKTELTVYINSIVWPTNTSASNLHDILKLVLTIEALLVCDGTGVDNKVSTTCTGENLRRNCTRCYACARLRRALKNKSKKINKRQIQGQTKLKITRKQYSNKCHNLKTKQLHQKIFLSKLQNRMAAKENIGNLISKLPENQKLVVKTCFEAAGRQATGRRYSKDWLYNCILMKIKSPKLYKHLRTKELLPLPAPCTLSKYIRNIDSSYGFQMKLFEMLKEKCKHMPEFQRHGTIMVDEMKVSPSKHFDKNRLQVMGFVDLGEYTPASQKDQLGDHALVIMFQSFAGHNMQALACFLSKGNVTGSIQAKLILEAVLLCEAAGLYIDVVTSDGAAWNRSMWKEFKAENSDTPWCIHPCNRQRKLRMCSDYLHLLKCVRNRLVTKKEFHVPEGRVRLQHFQNLLEYDAKHEFKLAYKLTPKHLNPQNHEKMTTKLAFQLFSDTVADALFVLKEKNIIGFQDAEPTIQFCRRINLLSDILNSNSYLKALRPDSEQERELKNFLLYLELWESCSEPDFYLTKSTAEGLKATISTTLDLLSYCTKDLGFQYLMTTRINQDPLEHFFGLLRASGGDNNNAESFQIAQIFRLVSLYSLVKPPAGSNVSGGNMLEALANSTNDLLRLRSGLNI